MKRGSNNRENEVYVMPPIDPLEGKVDQAALRAFREALSPMPGSVRAMFDALLFMPAHVRLMRALIGTARLMLQEGFDAAGTNGLTLGERAALSRLHMEGMSIDQLGTAHTLLCVPQRILFLRQWRDEARRVLTQKHNYLTILPRKDNP